MIIWILLNLILLLITFIIYKNYQIYKLNDFLNSKNIFIITDIDKKYPTWYVYFKLNNLINFVNINLIFEFFTKVKNKKEITLIIHTFGGESWCADTLSLALSCNENLNVTIYVPEYALSAGTMISLCGDKIFCNWYSIFSPIDTQIKIDDDFTFSTKYIKKFKKISDDKILFLQSELSTSLLNDDKKNILKILKNNSNKYKILSSLLYTTHSHDYQILGKDLKDLNLPVSFEVPTYLNDVFFKFKLLFNL